MPQKHSFFNSATDTIFDQLHASAALPSGNNPFTHSVRESVVSRPSLDNLASCILYFSFVSIFWQVFYCQLMCWVCWQKLMGILSIHSGD